MDGWTSLTQGFSVHKPKKTKKNTGSILDKHALQHFQEPLETAPLRQELYEGLWKSFFAKIEDFEESWHASLTLDVAEFIRTNLPTMSSEFDRVIPSAVLVTALSPEENTMLFDCLIKRGREDFPLLARTSSASCTNVKIAFQNISKQLMSSNTNVSRFVDDSQVELDDDEDEEHTTSTSFYQSSGCHKRQASTEDLNTWYETCSRVGGRPPIALIVLEDIDMFPEMVVHDLLELLSCCKFPFILVLGVLHGFCPLEQILPSESETPFTYKKFYATASPNERLEKFFDVVLFDWEFPFRLSGDIIKFMSEYFRNNHFSIKRLLQAYKLCLIQHFRSPFSLFCTSDYRAICDKMRHCFSEEIFENTLKSIPSWEDYMKQRERQLDSPAKHNSPAKQMKTLNIGEKQRYPLERISSQLKVCYNQFFEWNIMLLFIYEMGCNLPDKPVGVNLSHAYTLAWNGELHKKESDEAQSRIEKLLLLIQNFSKKEMERRLSNARKRVHEFTVENKESRLVDTESSGLPSQVNFFLARLMEKPKEKTAEEVRPTRASPGPSRLMSAANLYELRENLLNNIKSMKVDPEYDTLRDDIKRFIKVHSRSKLKAMPETCIPFAEVFVYGDVDYLRNQIAPNVQRRIHTALCSPHGFLLCECCEGLSPESNDKNLPDTSIVYKLYLEQQTKNINMNDMFMAFKSIIAEPGRTKKGASISKKAAEKEDEYLVRFKHAVSELEFMGFMKASRTKADEVQKQCWTYSAFTD